MAQFTNINNDLIIRYLRNELSEQEKLDVIAWLEADQQNMEFLFGLKEAYLISRWDSVRESADVDNEWEKIHSQIISDQKANRVSTKKLFLRLSKYAAILILTFGLGFVFDQYFVVSNNHETTFTTGSGRSSIVQLADGSKVTLNAQSTLTYNNSLNEREVTLKGEAVFDIRKNKGKPFYVNTSNYRIKVLGTVFNVSTYDNDDYVSTTLKRGKIEIVEIGTNKVLSELKEGERFYLDKKTGNYSIKMEQNLSDDFGWYEGKLCFNDIPLKDLTNKMEREFGFAIEIKNHKVQTYRYKANIEKESLENIMKYISIVTPNVHYKINYETRKILIY